MYKANNNELEVLNFWKKDKTFEKSVNERSEEKPYVFYDGPPFATGLPHYGHIVASTMKDTVPRYWTMKGYRVERRWGWDCHGLPIENIIEKELNLPGKKELEAYGIDAFNEACRSTVLKYANEWSIIINRIGRWVDMENDYKTMDVEFMESVWWVFKELWDKGYVYEGKKPMHICPRCATPLSNFEVTQGYKDIKDLSVTAKFTLLEPQQVGPLHDIDMDGPVHLLAWTTTPWTLPGNILVAVEKNLEYSLVKLEGEYYIVAKDLLMKIFEGKPFEVMAQMKGSDLVGAHYEPVFPYFLKMEGAENGFRVVHADFVTTDEGTGLVHLAPAFGTDDYEVFRKENVPFIQHVTMDGRFTPEVTDFAGMEVKQREDHMATDVEMVKYLASHGKLFSKQKYEHSYPHCWRCDTPLLNYATSSWFVEVTKIKEQLLKNNQNINWIPEHIKDGRFGKWLEGAKDWAISRNRYWGTPLPVWRCDAEECGEIAVMGSVAELEKHTSEKVDDLHKHIVDKLTFSCEKCGQNMKRIEEVFDCWFESGAMPYGQMHYPFENKQKFEHGFPAQFIAEGQDQTRGWFYTLHILATALTYGEKPSIPVDMTGAFRNVIVNGLVLAEDGKKMSKRLQNYPDPMDVVDKYGADAIRFYLITSPVMHAESLNFSEEGVREMYNKVCNTLWNVLEFYKMFAGDMESPPLQTPSPNVLDKWILARLQELIRDVSTNMEAYALAEASRPIIDFVADLSQWYVRRSRDRFKGSDEEDAAFALSTLHNVLETTAKVLAPFTPFLAEKLYGELQNWHLHGDNYVSVHLQAWPEGNGEMQDEQVLKDMNVARKIVELGLSARKEAGIKVRQPLQYIRYQTEKISESLEQIIAEELNVKEVMHTEAVREQDDRVVKEDQNIRVGLNVIVTDELKKEGVVRELIRATNQERKKQGLTIEDKIALFYDTDSEDMRTLLTEYAAEIQSATLALELEAGSGGEPLEIDEMKIALKLEVKN